MVAGGGGYNFYIVSHGGLSDPFWRPVKKGMETAAKLLDVKATYFGPEEKYSTDALVDNVKKATAAKPDGIAVTITNVKILEKLLKEAIIEKKIPIIAINVPDFRPIEQRIPYLFYIGMDEYVCGKRLAERMLVENEFIPTRAVIGIHEEGHIGLENRAKGIEDAFRKRNILTDKLYITTESRLATEKFKKYREEHPESNVIFTLGPLGTDPALNFLEEEGLVGKVKLATVDRLPRTTSDIKEGRIVCTAEQGPYLQGFLPIWWFYQYYINPDVSLKHDDTFLGPTIVDKYNIEYIENLEKVIEHLDKLLDDKSKKKLKDKFEGIWNNIIQHRNDVITMLHAIACIAVLITR